MGRHQRLASLCRPFFRTNSPGAVPQQTISALRKLPLERFTTFPLSSTLLGRPRLVTCGDTGAIYTNPTTLCGRAYAGGKMLYRAHSTPAARTPADAGVTARRRLEVTSWRFVCRFAQVPKGRAAKTDELRGASRARAWPRRCPGPLASSERCAHGGRCEEA